MHVGWQLGIAAGIGAVIGAVGANFAIEPDAGRGQSLASAGAGITGLFGASALRGAQNPPLAFVGVGAGAMIAAAGVTTLFAS